jgi:methionyl-tRNA synthetase
MVFGQDQDYSDQALIARYNADLANDLGNTLSRAIKMSDTYFDGKTPPERCFVNDLRKKSEQVVPQYLRNMDELAFQRALENAWELLTEINSYIVTREPWRRFKENGADGALSRILWDVLEALRIVWVMMAPFMPESTRVALKRLGANPDRIGADALQWGELPARSPVVVADPIFPRIDAAQYMGDIKPMSESESKPTTTPDAPAESDAIPVASGPPVETTQAAPPDLAKISIDQFMEIDLRVAEVRAAERVPKSKKLIKMTVFTGDGERTIVAGIGTKYAPEELVGRKVVIVANLQPAKLMGVESNGMVLAASIDGEASLLSVDAAVPAGTKVK